MGSRPLCFTHVVSSSFCLLYRSRIRPIYCSCFISVLLSSYLLVYSSQSQIACLPYFHTWCGLSANLECMSEMCCTRLAENLNNIQDGKIRHLRTIAQIFRAMSSQLRYVSTIGKKLVNQQHILHMSTQYGELRTTDGCDRLPSFWHPCKFQRVLCSLATLCFFSGSNLRGRRTPPRGTFVGRMSECGVIY